MSEWTDVTVLKLAVSTPVPMWEEVDDSWNPHVDLDDPAAGPTALGEQFGAGWFFLYDNIPSLVHPDDPHETEHRAIFREVLEVVTTSVDYSYHAL